MTPLIRFALGFMLVFSSLFLIALVLIQRGRGGGLAGAFGGMGGQSAFGTKAGDVFTKITVVVAACWILLCILAINVLSRRDSLFSPNLGGMSGQKVPAQTAPAAGTPPATPAGGTTDGGTSGGTTDGGSPPAAPAVTEPAAATPAASTTPAAPSSPAAPAADSAPPASQPTPPAAPAAPAAPAGK